MAEPEWGADVCRLVFGGADAAAAVQRWLEPRVGRTTDVELVASSMVAVFRADTERHGPVAVRVHQPGVDAKRIAQTNEVQHAVIARGLPAPTPIHGPEALGNGIAVVESFLRSMGRLDNNWDAPVAQAMGRGLGVLTLATADLALELDSHTFREGDGRLVSHTSIFNFEATASGAEWIEEYAARAHAELCALPVDSSIATHRDWRLGNVDVADGQILAIYDWSSLERWPEAEAVGSAAIGFGAWHGEDGRKAGTPDEASAFVAAYEAAVGRTFSFAQRRIAGVSAVLHLAFVARCEHSVGWHDHPYLAQFALREFGEELLRGIAS